MPPPSYEWWTNPDDAARRLDALTLQWSELSNAALGRGVTPLVSEPFAGTVARSVAKFREWRAGLGGYENVLKWRDGLEQWTTLANKLRAQIQQRGIAVPPPLDEVQAFSPRETLETFTSGPVMLGALALGVLWLIGRSYNGQNSPER